MLVEISLWSSRNMRKFFQDCVFFEPNVQVLNLRQGKKEPSVNGRISASEFVWKGLARSTVETSQAQVKSPPFVVSTSKPILRICLPNLFSLYGLQRIVRFFILAIPFIFNFRPSLAATDTLSPLSHRIKVVATQRNSSCILELGLSHCLFSSDALVLWEGHYYQLAGFVESFLQFSGN